MRKSSYNNMSVLIITFNTFAMVSGNKNDHNAILKKLTFKKVVNASKLYSSFWISRVIGKPVLWGKPFSLSIEPTTACNLRCPECPSGLRKFTRNTGNLTTELNEQILEELSPTLSYINFYFQGEPYIHPNLFKLIRKASSLGIYSATSTNGHFLDDERCKKTIESGLDRLIISLDGTTQEVYEQYRIEGDLEKVIEGTKNLVKWKKNLGSQKPHIIFQFLVVKPNEHQIKEAKELSESIGVDEIRFKTAQIYDFKNGSPLIPSDENYSRYKKTKNGEYVLKNKTRNHCWRMWSGSVITWDGNVVPCCFDKDATHQLGNLDNSKFIEIWKSPSYNQFRGALLKGRNEIDICQNCSEGSKVWT